MKKKPRPKWYLIYYLLAAFDIFSVSISLYLNHQIMGIYTTSVTINQEWAIRLNNYAKLGKLAAAVNAPGNDIFASKNVEAESKKLQIAITDFNNYLDIQRRELRNYRHQPNINNLFEDFEQISTAIVEMNKQSKLIFVYFKKQEIDIAAQQMAVMDRKYSNVNDKLADLRKDARFIQSELLKQQIQSSNDLQKFEYIIAIFIILMVVSATIYGYHVATEMRLNELQKQQYIQDLKQSEIELRLAETKLKYLLSSNPAVIYSCKASSDYEATFISENIVTVMGYAREDFLNNSDFWLNHIHPEDLSHILSGMSKLFEQGYYSHDYRFLHKNGVYRWMHDELKLIKDENDHPIKIVGFWLDITERKQVEKQLEIERQQLQQIISNAPVAIAIFDTEMRYLAHSHKWLEDYNITEQSIIGKSHYQIFPDIPEAWKIIHQRGLRGEILSNPEDMFERENGLKTYLRWAITPWQNFEANIGGIVMVTQTVNELVEAREAAIENSRIKSQFLANMSHEIRTPMNGILGMTGLVLETKLTAEQKDFLQTIRISADNLLIIINDILDFSKLEAGQMQLEDVEFNLNTCVEEVIDLLSAQASNKGIELGALVDENIPVNLGGDVGRLRQILMNLVGNAIKFTHVGEVLIQATLQSQTIDKAKIKLSVKDTGIGINEENQTKLFQSFSQVDASNTRKYGGTGLGLAICKQLVELMGSKIEINSSLGEGATFFFSMDFPIINTQVIPKINRFSYPQYTISEHLKTIRVLVVDDNPTSGQIITAQLSLWGINVDSVVNAKEALLALQNAVDTGIPYDVALIDLEMPETDGKTLAKIINENPNLLKTRLIMMTFMNQSAELIELQTLGFSGYLIKPIKSSRLLDCIMTILDSQVIENISLQERLEVKHAQTIHKIPNSKLNILVAEDNLINQKVIRNQLKILGYQADFVENGQHVLNLLFEQVDQNTPVYDIVFMDCQMPILDGYKTTETIRMRETGDSHTTIIAMTAHAMKGDKEKCLAAGMDDYISKPVDLKQLKAMIENWTAITEVEEQESIMINQESIVDLSRLQEISGGDEDFEREILAEFVNDAQTQLESLKLALASVDFLNLKHYAHQIKGAAGNVGTMTIYTVAAQIEKLAIAQISDDLAENVIILETSLNQVQDFVNKMDNG